MKLSDKQGILWALGTALISGVSVYVNKFGVAQVKDPFIYTSLKNTVVALGFLAAVALLFSWRELHTFTPRQWAGWVGLGLIGGGIPFLLFFQGLATASAPSAALIHKTLFLWVALLAVPFLSERLGWWQIAGLGVLAAGQFLLQPPSAWGWGSGETLILIATLLWAVETVLAKKVLVGISAHTGALGRMGIGALMMWGFLTLTGRAGEAVALTGTQWFWVTITSVFLMGYVWTWYSALKAAPAVLVTSVLVLGAVITVLLTALLEGKGATAPQIGAMVLIALGAAAFAWRPRPSPTQATGAA
ncbi:MAG: DMT family transporter [Anaerolineales bacterium]